MQLFQILAVSGVLLALGCATQSAQRAPRLVFDVHPCAGEVHLAMKDVQVVDANGQPLPAARLAGEPKILLRDGQRETELGSFESGCGGGLRLHVPLPETTSTNPEVILRGQLQDGTPVVGRQVIVADEYR